MIRVLIVDDDPLVRSGLMLMLAGAGDITVVGEVGDGADVVDAVTRLDPQVVLMDIRMPVIDGIAATQALSRRYNAAGDPHSVRPAVVVLTTFDADEIVLAALRAGAVGFLLKHTPPAEFVDAVRRTSAGEPVLSPSVTRSLITLATQHSPQLDTSGAPADDLSRMSLLSVREREVALAVAEGLSNTEIGQRLFLSASSIKATVSSALAKLGLANRIQLAIVAHESRRGTASPGA
ncbi:response regulator transcription factor [Allokutzneria sp. A3M-2-11 16]|uniref:response regulator transcription factor n=1 Tax=Allokutzneria sp. A3M-2-11 16 TaxID=2962043 RepID=UPI0020B82CB8|nr:response regulator transcription factor [Allokutzneria sp. A3M-2-11 16]MCP3802017.1 response regulator transcription factor [Allokutzneria sp. A3M-2-11 16]